MIITRGDERAFQNTNLLLIKFSFPLTTSQYVDYAACLSTRTESPPTASALTAPRYVNVSTVRSTLAHGHQGQRLRIRRRFHA